MRLGNLGRSTSQATSRPLWFDCTILGFGLFAVFLACANFSEEQITDNVSTFTAGWAVGQHGELDISAAPNIKPWAVPVDGELHSDRAPGLIVWVSPFYSAFGRPAYPTTFPAGAAAALSAAIAMSLLFAALSRLVSRRLALLSTLLASFGTATWTVSADAVWPHGPDQLWLCALLLAVSSNRTLIAGAAGAAALVTRPITAVATAAIGITLAVQRRSLVPAVNVAVTSSLGLVALLAYNRYAFGAWTVAPGSYHEFVGQFAGQSDAYDPTDPLVLIKNIAGAVISPSRGILVLSPWLLMLVPGLRASWKVAPSWVRAGAMGALSYAAVQFWGNNFAGGAGFYSYRYAIEPLTLAAPLLLLCWTTWTAATRGRRRLFLALAAASVAQHAAGAFYISTTLRTEGWTPWQHFLFLDLVRQAPVLELTLTATATVATLLLSVCLSEQRRRRPVQPGKSQCPST